jgi:uncharacterized membrane protein
MVSNLGMRLRTNKYRALTIMNYVILAFLVLIPRIFKLDRSFWFDEGVTAHYLQQTPREIVHFLMKEDVHAPLYFIAIHYWGYVFSTDWGIRLFSVLAAVISVLILFKLCSRLFERNIAWVAAALFAFSPFHLAYSQEARPYSLYTLLSVTSLWLIVKALESEKLWNICWIIYLIAAPMIFYTQPAGGLILLGLAAFHLFLIWRAKRARFFQFIGIHAVALLICLPYLFVIFKGNVISGTSEWFGLNWIPAVNLKSLFIFMRAFIYYPPYEEASLMFSILWMVPSLALLVLASFVIASAPGFRKQGLALLGFAAVPIIIATIYGLLIKSLYVPRYFAPLVIPLVILTALPLASFEKSYWRKPIVFMTATAIVFSLVCCVAYLRGKGGGDSWKESVREIRQNIQPDDIIIILPKGAIFVFNWYFKEYKDNHTVMSADNIEDIDWDQFESSKGRRLWIIKNRWGKETAIQKVMAYIEQKYKIEYRVRFRYNDVLLVNLSQIIDD